jgi:hypothetical protein
MRYVPKIERDKVSKNSCTTWFSFSRDERVKERKRKRKRLLNEEEKEWRDRERQREGRGSFHL